VRTTIRDVALPAARRPALDRKSPVPLWSQLLDDLRRRVGEGDFEDRFPSELELVEEYGVSRNTVREVLRRLRDEGTVVAGRGRRPQLNREIRQPLGAFYSLYESIEAAGLHQRSVVRRFEVRTDAAASRKLEVPTATPLVVLERIRFGGDEPLALDTVYLPGDLARPLLGAELATTSLYQLLAERTGVRLTDGEEVLRAVEPTDTDRRDLELPEGVALLAIERLGRMGGRAVEWRHTLVRGDRFSLVASFSLRGVPEPGGALSSRFSPAPRRRTV